MEYIIEMLKIKYKQKKQRTFLLIDVITFWLLEPQDERKTMNFQKKCATVKKASWCLNVI